MGGARAENMEKMQKIIGCIPARSESSRFPGKPLCDILGKPMIVRVLERAQSCGALSSVYVVTDSEVIFEAVSDHGGKAIMTIEKHASGSDRVAEAARKLNLSPLDIVVNIQGDQPLFDSEMTTQVIRPLIDDPSIPMSTLIYEIVREEEIHHPNAVKTVFDRDGFALYFSRSTVPFCRNANEQHAYYKHHGIYAFRQDFLQIFNKLPIGKWERAEGLEQLRALENGFKVRVVVTDKDSIEVDTLEDLERVRQEYRLIGII